MICTVQFRVRGRVQGVFFRHSTKEQADLFGLAGWVRNHPDGSVEGVAQGTAPALQSLRDWLGRGPPMAQVISVDWEEVEAEEFRRFEIRR
jgi:acylphosphatase